MLCCTAYAHTLTQGVHVHHHVDTSAVKKWLANKLSTYQLNKLSSKAKAKKGMITQLARPYVSVPRLYALRHPWYQQLFCCCLQRHPASNIMSAGVL